MKRLVPLVFVLTFLAITAPSQETTGKHDCPIAKPATDSKFEPGQVWEYKTRDGEEKSTITILKIEDFPKVGIIVHIRIDHIRLHNCAGGNSPDTIEHAPFLRSAIEASVTKLVKKDSVPDFSDGYAQWVIDCGGIYSITVAEMLEADEYIFRKGLGCHDPEPVSAPTSSASR